MKAINIILLGALAFLGYQAYELAAGTGTMQVILADVTVQSPLNYLVTLTVQNVSNASITVNSMTGNVLINGGQLASISYLPGAGNGTVVPPNGQINIPVTASASLLSLPGDIQQLVQSGGQTVDFTVTGNVNASGFVLPFTLDKTVNL